MVLDTRTLFVIFTLVTILLSCVMFFFWLVQKTYSGFTEWVITAFLAAVLYILFLLRGVAPAFLSYLVANSGLSAILILRLQGTKRYFGRPSVSLFYLLIPASVFFLYAYFYYIEDSIQYRTFFLSISITIMTIALAWEFYRNRNRGNPALNLMVAALNLIYGTLFFVRGIMILSNHNYRFLMNSPYETFFFVIAPLFEITWNVCFIMLNQQRTEEELREALASAEDANRAKTRFLGVMSHEMRTPLHSIKGASEMLDSTELSGEQKNYTGLLRRSSNILQHLLDEALDITLIESGRMEIREEPVSIPGLFEELREMFVKQFKERGIELSIKPPPGQDLIVYADRQRLLQVLGNLIGNSLKYTREGRVGLEGSYDYGPGPGSLMFTVRDTGIGIAPERLAAIFEPFSRMSDPYHRQQDGIGLGLSIVRNICRLMGGDIMVESTPGKGSTFFVRLPAKTPSADSISTADNPGGSVSLPPLFVLAVDDVQENLEILKFYFEGTGADLTDATTGQEALQKLSQQRFDCVLLDMQLPDISGMEIIRFLREEEKQGGREHIHIVGISANAYEKAGAEAISAGCDVFISRPFSRQDLFRAMLSIPGDDDGDAGIYKADAFPPEMVERARNRIKQCAIEITEECARGDFTSAERLGHSIKGLGRTFGIEVAAEIGGKIQAAAEKGDEEEVGLLAERLATILKEG